MKSMKIVRVIGLFIAFAAYRLVVLLLSTCTATILAAHAATFPKFGTFEHPIFKPLRSPANRRGLMKLTAELVTCQPDKWSSSGRGVCMGTDDLDAKCSDREISTSKECSGFDGNWCCYIPLKKETAMKIDTSSAQKGNIASATQMKTVQSIPAAIKLASPIDLKKEMNKDVKAVATDIKVHIFNPSENPHPALTRQRLQKLHTKANTLLNHRRFPIHSLRA